jgi:2,3-bisphosphoglycerate-dependent phosphoglycerate mutase
MATVILARHGRTAANAGGLLAGRTKGVHLDDVGTAQAQAASERLAGLELAAVVTSPLERCRQTARLLAPGVRVTTERRLLECDYGEWTGRELKHLAKEKLWRTVQAQPSGVRFPGGESLPEMSARAVAAVRDRDAALTESVGDHAVWLAVSHGDIIKAVLADALGMHLDAFQRIVVDPGSLSVVRYTPERAFVVTMNSSSGALAHLGTKPSRRSSRARSGDAVPGGGAGPGSTPGTSR